MNEKHGLVALFCAGLAFCAMAAWYCYLMRPALTPTLAFWLLGATVFVGLLVWVFVRKDKVPDYLAKLGLNYFEREGLCFVPVPDVEDGQCRMNVLFQNRYDTPCVAEILLKPDYEAAKANLKRLRLRVECDGAGHGNVSVPWPIPQALQGVTVTFEVGADVDYPQGRGRLIRFKDGTQVNSLGELDSGPLGAICSGLATLKLTLPASVSESVAFAQARGQADEDVLRQATTARDAVPAETATAASEANSGVHPLEPMPPPELDGTRLAEMIGSLKEDPSLRLHRRAVKELKSDQFWNTVGLTFLMGLGAAACLTYIVMVFVYHWDLRFKLLLLAGFFGLLLGIGAVMGLTTVLGELLRSGDMDPAESLQEACRGFYTLAFGLFGDCYAQFVAACQHFPVPVIRRYAPDLPLLMPMLRRWRDVREHYVAADAGFSVDAVTVAERPRSDGTLVDLTVCLSGSRFGEVRFRNLALHIHGKWFLATPEPLLEEATACPPASGESVSRQRWVSAEA